LPYFGREPYSTVDRIERRFEFTDNVTFVRGHHTFKVGGDFNLIQLRSAKAQIFELDFGGDVNFGGFFSASTFGFPDNVPGVTALPGTTASNPTALESRSLTSRDWKFTILRQYPIGLFAQDNWVLNKHLTINYGVRYDVENQPALSRPQPPSMPPRRTPSALWKAFRAITRT